MGIQSSLSVPLDGVVMVPYEITFTVGGGTARLLLASFDDGGVLESGWTSFVNGVASYLTGQGYANVTHTTLTTTEA